MWSCDGICDVPTAILLHVTEITRLTRALGAARGREASAQPAVIP
jgi:hypothetical protein